MLEGDYKRNVAYKMRLYQLAPDTSEMELYVTAACKLETGTSITYPVSITQELLDNVGPFVLPSNSDRPYAYIGQET